MSEQRDYQYKVLCNTGLFYTVIKYYVSRNLGECHESYIKVTANDEASAIEAARVA